MATLFDSVWKNYSDKLGLHYGEDVLESVRVGWDMAHDHFFAESLNDVNLYHFHLNVYDEGSGKILAYDGFYRGQFKSVHDHLEFKEYIRKQYDIPKHYRLELTALSKIS